MKSVLFYDAKPYDSLWFDPLGKDAGYTFDYVSDRLNPKTARLAEGYDAICLFVNDHVSPEVAEILHKKGVRFIAQRSAGYNNIDLKSVFKKIHVSRVPAYSPYAVAEHALALLMTLNRKIHKAYNRTREGNFAISGLMGRDLHGKTAGIVGTGKIGLVLINILRGLGMDVIAYDPRPREELAAQYGFRYGPLEELYKTADVISLHCPLTPETRHLINKEALAQMKDTAILINTGRGHLIDTKALIDVLKAGKIGAAGLDVYEEEEEYFFEDFSEDTITDDTLARLLTFRNVIVTSHQAFLTEEALKNIAETTIANLREFHEERPLTNEICYRCTPGPCPRETTGRCF